MKYEMNMKYNMKYEYEMNMKYKYEIWIWNEWNEWDEYKIWRVFSQSFLPESLMIQQNQYLQGVHGYPTSSKGNSGENYTEIAQREGTTHPS